MKKHKLLISFLLIFSCFSVFAQDPTRFNEKVKQINEENPPQNNQNTIVFTGSSTIRMWKSLQEDFPKHELVNSGFGGSQASDLLYFLNELVLVYNPSKVFIYEGDNDISAGKSSEEILDDYKNITTKIHESGPETEIILISPKPSVARWELKDKYLDFNSKLKKFAAGKKNVKYADLWRPMLDKNKEPMKDIFIEDNLHMNQKGYAIWAKIIRKYL
jgi:lysophospholipase L1-like esterase